MKSDWSTQDIPAQDGKIFVVTGPGGLGYETALALAMRGAEVILAGRNPQRGEAALAKIRQMHPAAKVRFGALDLASLASVRQFAQWAQDSLPSVDGLINNAGVMSLPTRQTTVDGFEMQLATNYLGHFALTARLLPLLRSRPGARVVNLSSNVHRLGRLDFDNLQLERGYKPMRAYGNSKAAMLMFALEFDRRSRAQGWGVMANAAHPGYARTDLIANSQSAHTLSSRLGRLLLEGWASQTAAAGALPTLYAATDPAAEGGAYYGPSRIFELIGPPAPAGKSKHAQDAQVGKRLWEVSEEITQARFVASTSTSAVSGRGSHLSNNP